MVSFGTEVLIQYRINSTIGDDKLYIEKRLDGAMILLLLKSVLSAVKPVVPKKKKSKPSVREQSTEHWWTWNWDRQQMTDCSIPYDKVVRWRRWLITLYRFDSVEETDWRLYLPGNLWLGITLDKKGNK
jgi:hypothetical protein